MNGMMGGVGMSGWESLWVSVFLVLVVGAALASTWAVVTARAVQRTTDALQRRVDATDRGHVSG